MLSYLVWIVVFRAVGELHAQRSGLCDRSSRTARRVTLRRFCVTPLGEALLEGSERCHAGASSLIRLTPPPKNNPGRRAYTSRPKSVAGAAARRSAPDACGRQCRGSDEWRSKHRGDTHTQLMTKARRHTKNTKIGTTDLSAGPDSPLA